MNRGTWLGMAVAAGLLAAGAWLRPHSGTDAPSASAVKIVHADATTTPTDDRVAPKATPAAVPQPAATGAADGDRIPDDPAIRGEMMNPEWDPAHLYKKLRAEPIDPVWAGKAKTAIAGAMVAVPYINQGDRLRVSCASTLCEVRGGFTRGLSNDNTNVAMKALQDGTLDDRLKAAGLERAAGSFGSADASGNSFTLYFRRR